MSRIIRATAPIRICDNGGWTDTWVARQGKVFNIAVRPLVTVDISVFTRGARAHQVVLSAENFGIRYAPRLDDSAWGPHPLLEAALKAIPPPDDIDIEVAIRSDAPAGASTGTSAAVVVALLGALDRLAGGSRSAHQIATEAHAVETDWLKRQSGVQDQLCSAYGGVNFIEIVDYPRAVVTPLKLPAAFLQALERRLALIFLGRPHSSSAVHEMVMRDLTRRGPHCAPLEALRAAAENARDAALAGDLTAFGLAMRDNTRAQEELHADLVGPEAWRVIGIAAAHRAAGWKVNGAGGDGGSITVLSQAEDTKASMIEAILQANPAFVAIPVTLSADGLRVS